jgi:hypothetical protein
VSNGLFLIFEVRRGLKLLLAVLQQSLPDILVRYMPSRRRSAAGEPSRKTLPLRSQVCSGFMIAWVQCSVR